MNRVILVLLYIITFKDSVVSQITVKNDSIHLVKLPEFYKYSGIVFCSNYWVRDYLPNLKERYTPSLEDIINSEQILRKNDSLLFDKKYKKFIRRYLGYIDNENRKVIYIELIKNKFQLLKRKLGKDWQYRRPIISADWYYGLYILQVVKLSP